MPEEEKRKRIKELRSLINQNLSVEINTKDSELLIRSNDHFDELVLLNPNEKIGLKNNQFLIISNDNELISFQLDHCIKCVINSDGQSKICLLMLSQQLENDEFLMSYLNENFDPNAEIIFVPVNKFSHWFLLAIDLKQNRTMIFDSMKNSSLFYNAAFKRAGIVIQLLGMNLNKHKFHIVQKCPSQDPGSLDCGVFLFNYIQVLLRTEPISVFDLLINFRRFLMNKLLLIGNQDQKLFERLTRSKKQKIINFKNVKTDFEFCSDLNVVFPVFV